MSNQSESHKIINKLKHPFRSHSRKSSTSDESGSPKEEYKAAVNENYEENYGQGHDTARVNTQDSPKYTTSKGRVVSSTESKLMPHSDTHDDSKYGQHEYGNAMGTTSAAMMQGDKDQTLHQGNKGSTTHHGDSVIGSAIPKGTASNHGDATASSSRIKPDIIENRDYQTSNPQEVQTENTKIYNRHLNNDEAELRSTAAVKDANYVAAGSANSSKGKGVNDPLGDAEHEKMDTASMSKMTTEGATTTSMNKPYTERAIPPSNDKFDYTEEVKKLDKQIDQTQADIDNLNSNRGNNANRTPSDVSGTHYMTKGATDAKHGAAAAVAAATGYAASKFDKLHESLHDSADLDKSAKYSIMTDETTDITGGGSQKQSKDLKSQGINPETPELSSSSKYVSTADKNIPSDNHDNEETGYGVVGAMGAAVAGALGYGSASKHEDTTGAKVGEGTGFQVDRDTSNTIEKPVLERTDSTKDVTMDHQKEKASKSGGVRGALSSTAEAVGLSSSSQPRNNQGSLIEPAERKFDDVAKAPAHEKNTKPLEYEGESKGDGVQEVPGISTQARPESQNKKTTESTPSHITPNDVTNYNKKHGYSSDDRNMVEVAEDFDPGIRNLGTHKESNVEQETENNDDGIQPVPNTVFSHQSEFVSTGGHGSKSEKESSKLSKKSTRRSNSSSDTKSSKTSTEGHDSSSHSKSKFAAGIAAATAGIGSRFKSSKKHENTDEEYGKEYTEPSKSISSKDQKIASKSSTNDHDTSIPANAAATNSVSPDFKSQSYTTYMDKQSSDPENLNKTATSKSDSEGMKSKDHTSTTHKVVAGAAAAAAGAGVVGAQGLKSKISKEPSSENYSNKSDRLVSDPNATSSTLDPAGQSAMSGGSHRHSNQMPSDVYTAEKGTSNSTGDNNLTVEVIGAKDKNTATKLALKASNELSSKGVDLSTGKLVINANTKEIFKTSESETTYKSAISPSKSDKFSKPDNSYWDASDEPSPNAFHKEHELVKDKLAHTGILGTEEHNTTGKSIDPYGGPSTYSSTSHHDGVPRGFQAGSEDYYSGLTDDRETNTSYRRRNSESDKLGSKSFTKTSAVDQHQMPYETSEYTIKPGTNSSYTGNSNVYNTTKPQTGKDTTNSTTGSDSGIPVSGIQMPGSFA